MGLQGYLEKASPFGVSLHARVLKHTLILHRARVRICKQSHPNRYEAAH